MPKYKVTKAKTYIVEAANKKEAQELVDKNEELYYDGTWSSVKELPKNLVKQAWAQLTG